MKSPWKSIGSGDEIRQALVYGLGLSGRAATRFLLERGVSVIGIDGRSREKLDLGELGSDPRLTVLAGGDPNELPGADVDLVIVSPGVPMTQPLIADARRRGVPVTGSLPA